MHRLRELRFDFGLTQRELAEKLSLTQTTIGKYERGELEPSIEVLKNLSGALECSVDYLIGHSDDFGNVTVYRQTEALNSLSEEEQKIIDVIRKTTPTNANEWITMYAELPRYMQESIFAELKGMYLGYSVSKSKKLKEGV